MNPIEAKWEEDDRTKIEWIYLPAVPRAGDELFLPREAKDGRQFTIHEVIWISGAYAHSSPHVQLWIVPPMT